jgi:hypothetical protein
VYYNKISELEKKIEVQQIRQRGTQDNKSTTCRRKHGKNHHQIFCWKMMKQKLMRKRRINYQSDFDKNANYNQRKSQETKVHICTKYSGSNYVLSSIDVINVMS